MVAPWTAVLAAHDLGRSWFRCPDGSGNHRLHGTLTYGVSGGRPLRHLGEGPADETWSTTGTVLWHTSLAERAEPVLALGDGPFPGPNWLPRWYDRVGPGAGILDLLC